MKKGYIAITIGKEPDGEDVVHVSDVYGDAWQVIDFVQKAVEAGKYTKGRVQEVDIIPGEKEKERLKKEEADRVEREKEAEELASINLQNLKRIRGTLERLNAGWY